MNTSIVICVADEALLPIKHTSGAVCWDLRISEDIHIEAGQIILAPTGVKIACPAGRHTKIYARSGLPLKSGLMLANGVGVMDNDYRGEYFLQLYNCTTSTVTHTAGSRLGQYEIVPYFLPNHITTLQLPQITTIIDINIFNNFEQHYPTQRGSGGFHSTGR